MEGRHCQSQTKRFKVEIMLTEWDSEHTADMHLKSITALMDGYVLPMTRVRFMKAQKVSFTISKQTLSSVVPMVQGDPNTRTRRGAFRFASATKAPFGAEAPVGAPVIRIGRRR